MSFEYERPLACHSLGYIEMLVKPGMVLISLRKMRGDFFADFFPDVFFARSSGSIRKSTRARPAQSHARKAAIAIARISFSCAFVSFAGMMGTDGSSAASYFEA